MRTCVFKLTMRVQYSGTLSVLRVYSALINQSDQLFPLVTETVRSCESIRYPPFCHKLVKFANFEFMKVIGSSIRNDH